MAYKEKLAAHRRAAMLGRRAIREGLKEWVPAKKKRKGGKGGEATREKSAA